MRQELVSFVKSCDVCQKTEPDNRRELTGKIPLSGLFHAWCIDFSGTSLERMLEINF